MKTLTNIITPFSKTRRAELKKIYNDSYDEHYSAMNKCSASDHRLMNISIMKMEARAWAGSKEDRQSIKGARDAYNDYMKTTSSVAS